MARQEKVIVARTLGVAFIALCVGFVWFTYAIFTKQLASYDLVTLKASKFNCYQNPMLKREVCGGDFETTIQRSQWGMNWGLNYGFPDNVKLLVQVEAVKQ